MHYINFVDKLNRKRFKTDRIQIYNIHEICDEKLQVQGDTGIIGSCWYMEQGKRRINRARVEDPDPSIRSI